MIKKRAAVFPLVLSAPSGGGKTAVRDCLLSDPRFGFSITCTTRQPRPGEVHGKDYYFLSKDGFLKLREENFLNGRKFTVISMEHQRNQYVTLWNPAEFR